MSNFDQVTFKELLAESMEVDSRTPEMINEAQENIRAMVDKHFKSVTKINQKAFEGATSYDSKPIVTTDGKWNIIYRKNITEQFIFSDSSNFMKNGNSLQFKVFGKSRNDRYLEVFNLVMKTLGEVGDDVNKLIAKLKEIAKDSDIIAIQEDHDSNKDSYKMNPYSMMKNVKPFTKTLEKNMKLRKDDIVKMIVNGQIKTITVGHHLTDDYHFDGAGRGMDALEFLKSDLLPARKPYINVGYGYKKGGGEGDGLFISFSVHSNYSVDLIPDPTKIKVETKK